MSQYDKMRADPLEAVRAARAIIADGDRRGQAAEQRTTVHTRQVLEALANHLDAIQPGTISNPFLALSRRLGLDYAAVVIAADTFRSEVYGTLPPNPHWRLWAAKRLSEQLGDTSRVAAALGAIRETERKEQLRRQQEVADLLVDYGCHYLDGVCKCEAYYDCKYYRKDFPGGNRGLIVEIIQE